MKPKVSVVMSVYNGEQYLLYAINSILNQTFSDFEFIIIDDGSTDSTSILLQQYSDDRIKIIHNCINIGLTKSLNIGINYAKGDFIARMDADDISLPERFEKQVDYLNKHQYVGVVGTSYEVIDDNGSIIYKKKISKCLRKKDLRNRNMVVHGSVMVRRKILEVIKGYDEIFKRGQDYNLWLQLSNISSICIIPEILYKFRLHRNSISHQGDDSILFELLALRNDERKLSAEIRDAIDLNGIQLLKKSLTKKELIRYHYSQARIYRFHNNFQMALNEHTIVFFLHPLHLFNLYHMVMIHIKKCFNKKDF